MFYCVCFEACCFCGVLYFIALILFALWCLMWVQTFVFWLQIVTHYASQTWTHCKIQADANFCQMPINVYERHTTPRFTQQKINHKILFVLLNHTMLISDYLTFLVFKDKLKRAGLLYLNSLAPCVIAHHSISPLLHFFFFYFLCIQSLHPF